MRFRDFVKKTPTGSNTLECPFYIPPLCLYTKFGAESPILGKKAESHRLWYGGSPSLVRRNIGGATEEERTFIGPGRVFSAFFAYSSGRTMVVFQKLMYQNPATITAFYPLL